MRNTQVQLQLEDAVTRKLMTRVVDLRPVDAQSRDRLMALTVAEFVLASWAELQLVQSETLEPVGTAPAPGVQQRAVELVETHLQRSSSLQLGAAAELLLFMRPFSLVPSLTLRATVKTAQHLALRIGAQLGRSSLDGQAGDVHQAVQVRMVMASLLAALLYTDQLAGLDCSAGVGVRVGFVQLTGALTDDPALQPVSAFAPWAGPLLTLGVAQPVSSAVRLVLALEAGLITLQPNALGPDASLVTRLHGLWAGASLGLELAL